MYSYCINDTILLQLASATTPQKKAETLAVHSLVLTKVIYLMELKKYAGWFLFGMSQISSYSKLVPQTSITFRK